jgi:hypothetical protein
VNKFVRFTIRIRGGPASDRVFCKLSGIQATRGTVCVTDGSSHSVEDNVGRRLSECDVAPCGKACTVIQIVKLIGD